MDKKYPIFTHTGHEVSLLQLIKAELPSFNGKVELSQNLVSLIHNIASLARCSVSGFNKNNMVQAVSGFAEKQEEVDLTVDKILSLLRAANAKNASENLDTQIHLINEAKVKRIERFARIKSLI